MSPLDQTHNLSLDHSAVDAANWPITPSRSPEIAGASPGDRTWAVRRTIVRVRAALNTVRLEEATKLISQLGRLLSHLERSKGDRYVPTLRLLQASLHAAADRLAAARAALASLPAYTTDPILAPLIGYLDWARGASCPDPVPDLADYLSPPVGGRAVARVFGLCINAALSIDRMHLTVASSLASEALQLARDRFGTQSPMRLLPATLLAQVSYEQGRLAEAEILLRPRMAAILTSGTLECAARASVVLARISLHRGQRRAALATLRDAETLGRARRWPRLISIAISEYRRIQSTIRCEDNHIGERATLQLRIAAQLDLSTRLRRLGIGKEGSQGKSPVTFQQVEAALQHVCLYVSGGHADEGYALLIQCLRIGTMHGLQMVFVDSDPALLNLLERLYSALATVDSPLMDLRPYVATLLRSSVPAGTEPQEPTTYRPLSRRETDILELISRGMSNKHIAQALGITPETVKWYAKSIFVKLDTRTRAQAVSRAESIGLL